MPATAPAKLTAVVEAPLHKTWLAGCITFGDGLTVIVKDRAVPGQPAAEGFTVMVAATAIVPKFVAVKDEISPLPVAPKPMLVLLFVQLYIVPATAPAKLTTAVVVPLHKTWLAGCTTLGAGLTVIVNDLGVPGQPAVVGVTVIVAVTGVIPALTAVKAGIFPLPVAPKPMVVLLFTQL